MDTQKIFNLLCDNLKFSPNEKQINVIEKLSLFINDISFRGLFLLKGYAGTGKTSLIGSLVKSLLPIGKKMVLLAPTGRAAKVLSFHTKKKSLTIHKKIYWIKTNVKGNTYVTIKKNTHTNTIFIVDECSMIPDVSDQGFGGRSLLDDLIKYVYDGVNCKLILIGDTAQLPPVKLDISPALDENFLFLTYNKKVVSYELTEVMRQTSNSMILNNATLLRNSIKNNDNQIPKLSCNNEVVRLNNGIDIQEALEDAYSKSGVEGTIVICKSNKRANMYSQQIRSKIRWQEDDISVGDYLMVVRNNYFWLPEDSKIGFIANGDTVEVLRIYEKNNFYNFRFARILIRMVDYPNSPNLEVIVNLNILTSDNPSMKYEDYKKLFESIEEDHMDISEKNIRFKKIKKSPYLNALQIKFAYAVTCHKSQGGQWENVFVEQGYFNSNTIDNDYLKWLYTAITRSTKKLYLINFKDQFFK